jgi:outer membrane protein W
MFGGTMKRIIIFFMIGFYIFIIYASDINIDRLNNFNVGFKSGIFIPQNSIIQGYSYVLYNSDGSPFDIEAEGFGNSGDIRFYFTYNSSNLSIMIESGIIPISGNNMELALAPHGDRESYENQLNIIPLTFSLIHKIKLKDQKFTPVIGFGLGLYHSECEIKHSYYDENHEYHSNSAKGSSNPVGIHFLSGFEYPVYYSISFNFEFRYSFIQSNWKIENKDTKAVLEYQNLNIGGTSLMVGLGFSF